MRQSRTTGMEIIKKLAIDYRMNFGINTTTYRKPFDNKTHVGIQTERTSPITTDIHINTDQPFDMMGECTQHLMRHSKPYMEWLE